MNKAKRTGHPPMDCKAEEVRIVGHYAPPDGSKEGRSALSSMIQERFPHLPTPQPVVPVDAQGLSAFPRLADFYEIRAPIPDALAFVRSYLELEADRWLGPIQVQTDPVVGTSDEGKTICSRFPTFPSPNGNDIRQLPELIHDRDPQCDPPPSFHTLQRYLGAASRGFLGGVGAQDAWSLPGGRGDGVRIADVDLAWAEHVDLAKAEGGLGPKDAADLDRNHGLAVHGILAARNDGSGIDGVAPEAKICRYPIADSCPRNVAHAICRAIRDLEDGDVILLETQYLRVYDDGRGGCCYSPLLPHETAIETYVAIESAVEAGIHVVAAAGNGRTDVSGFMDAGPDSGAILVAAGQPASGERVPRSNFGSRVDLFSWGDFVLSTALPETCEIHSPWNVPGKPSRCYDWFHDTSAASAIVAGVVACLSGILKQRQVCLRPSEMRSLLVSTGYEKSGTKREEIGVHPDLRAACLALQRQGVLPDGWLL